MKKESGSSGVLMLGLVTSLNFQDQITIEIIGLVIEPTKAKTNMNPDEILFRFRFR